MTNETPTPETDAAAYEATPRTVGKWIIPLSKARKMERKRDQYKSQRDEARATCSELVTDSDAITLARTVVRVTQERDEARAQRDRLAEALTEIRKSYGGMVTDEGCNCCDCEFLRPIDATLATLNQPEP